MAIIKEILNTRKLIDGLSSAMIQAAAIKYVNPSKYIRVVLKPENSAKPLKAF